MKLGSRRLIAALGCFVLVGWPTASRAAVVTVSELATPDDVQSSREVILDVPFSFKTFIDRLSVQAPAVTLAGGDTLNFHLALAPPSRFAISTTAQVFSVGMEMRSSGDATAAARAGTDPAVVLLAPDEGPPPPGPHFTAYVTDPASGHVAFLSVVQQYGSPPPVAALEPPRITFGGFDGTVLLPAEFPTTTFDRGVSLVVTGQVYKASDPPPPLAYLTTV